MHIPIVILSYNRPNYLKLLLNSLTAQILCDIHLEYHLFQDGVRSIDDIDLNEKCIATFCRYIPSGAIHHSDTNLGIAKNYDRAERYVFDEKEFEFAVFLEDDLILQPHYMMLLARIIKVALCNPRIGMVSAIGINPTAPSYEQHLRSTNLVHMGRNWGFGLTRRHWIERQEVLRPYLEIISSCDYRLRPRQKIWEWYASLGFGVMPTSQDRAKNLATLSLGVARLTTITVNAKYIGMHGEHSTHELYFRDGHDKTILWNGGCHETKEPTKSELDKILSSYREKIIEDSNRNGLSEIERLSSANRRLKENAALGFVGKGLIKVFAMSHPSGIAYYNPAMPLKVRELKNDGSMVADFCDIFMNGAFQLEDGVYVISIYISCPEKKRFSHCIISNGKLIQQENFDSNTKKTINILVEKGYRTYEFQLKSECTNSVPFSLEYWHAARNDTVVQLIDERTNDLSTAYRP